MFQMMYIIFCYYWQPVFMFVSYHTPHTPLQAPQEYIDMYPDIEDEDRRTHAGKAASKDFEHYLVYGIETENQCNVHVHICL